MSVDVAIRLGMKGGKEVEKAFGDIGKTGGAELKQLRAAANDLSPAMVAASRGVSILKDRTEELVAQTGNLGKLAGSFGIVGTAVAVGVIAVAGAAAVAFDKAREAAEFADNLDDTATKIGTTTTALQEYQYAIVATGGEAADAATGIDQFNVKFGEARSGLSAKAMKPFAALGFDKDDLKDAKAGSDLIPEIADRISKLGSVAEQAAVADKLGLKPLLPLLMQGRDGIERYREEAHRLGAVMDEDFVKKGADANQQFQLTAMVMSVQLKSAFIDLAPFISDFVAGIANAVKNLREFFQTADNGLSTSSNRTSAQLEVELNAKKADAERARAAQVAAATTGTVRVATYQGRAGTKYEYKDARAGGGRAGGSPLQILSAEADAAEAEVKRLAGALEQAKKVEAAIKAKGDGTSLIHPTGTDPKDKSDAEAKARAAELARATAEYNRIIATSMKEEEKAAFELKLELEQLQLVGTKAGVSQAEIDRQKALAQAHYETAKAIRQQKADDEDAAAWEKQNNKIDEAAKKAIGDVDKYRKEGETPAQAWQRDVDALDAARDAAKGLVGEMTSGEYDAALKKINDRYGEMRQAIYAATVQGQLMTAVINGQIHSWKDLGDVALKILSDIIQKAATQSVSGGGSFWSNLLSVGAKALGGVIGGGGFSSLPSVGTLGGTGGDFGVDYGLPTMKMPEGMLSATGRATGGPIYAGDTRWTGEQGRERISARSDGYVTDAATTAAALRAQRPASQGGGGGSGSGAIGVTLNNMSGTRLSASASQTTDDKGRSGVKIDLVEELDGRIEQRFGQMFDGKRDDARFAGSFGVRRRLSGD